MPLRHAWVLLTMGDRNDDLATAVRSIEAAGGTEVVVVVNGADPAPIETILGAQASVVALDENVGIPEGRNRGLAATDADVDVVFFLDDDAAVVSEGLAGEAVAMFDADPSLGIVSLRIVDPVSGETSRRHVPRLRASDPAHSGRVTSFLGGASAIRRACFDDAKGYDGSFFYAMEETDLSLRAIDAGWGIEYRGDLVVHHPATAPARHAAAFEHTARNRVLLARRNLPAPLGAIYVLDWLVLGFVRQRSFAALRASIRGTREGYRRTVDRNPISWRTVWRLTRLGRPPII